MVKLSKRMRSVREGLDLDKFYTVGEAISQLKTRSKAKFDETLEISMKLGIDPRHADQQVRGVVTLPGGTGKTTRVVVFAKGDKAEEAEKAGADAVGGEDLAKRIQDGWLDFDRCIAVPDMMGVVGRLGKILGPRNLMPNPKLGSVTPNVADAVSTAKAGQVQYRAEREGTLHAGIGKVSFSEQSLLDNAKAFISAIKDAKPNGAKGTYMLKVSLSSTM
ncbi:MAG: 50S ribosomal protein L1, partial [Pseudomonadota bacterium]